LVLGQDKLWNIKIDKRNRNEHERVEAESLLDDVASMDYESMFNKQKREAGAKERGIMKALKEEHEQDLMIEEKQFENMNDEEKDKQILNDAA